MAYELYSEVSIELNQFQKLAIKYINSIRDSGKNKAILSMPPGVGKTRVAIKDSLRYKKVLYIAHTRELVIQTLERYKSIIKIDKDLTNIIDLSLIKNDSTFNFVTIQYIRKNIKQFNFNEYDYIIIDEAHHCCAKSYLPLLDKFTGFLLGLTATPFRLDNKNVIEKFDNNYISIGNLKDAIRNNYLSKFKYRGFLDKSDYSNIFDLNKYSTSDIDKQLFIDDRDKHILEIFDRYKCNSRRTIGFCNSIMHAERMEQLFINNNIPCAAVSSRTPVNKRKQIIKDFKNKKIKIIFSINIFNEGLDFPFADCVLLLRPSASKGLVLQQIGRCLRISKDKEEALILDFIGNNEYSNTIRHVLSDGIFNIHSIMRKPIFVYPESCDIIFEESLETLLNDNFAAAIFKDIKKLYREYICLRVNKNRILFEEDILLGGGGLLRDFVIIKGIEELWLMMQEKISFKHIRAQKYITKRIDSGLSDKEAGVFFRTCKPFFKLFNDISRDDIIKLTTNSVTGRCPVCWKNRAISLHHILPRKYGGKDKEDNTIWLCSTCHDKIEYSTEAWIKKHGATETKFLRNLILNKGFKYE